MFAGPSVGCETKLFFIDVFFRDAGPPLTYRGLGVKIQSRLSHASAVTTSHVMLFYIQISKIPLSRFPSDL